MASSSQVICKVTLASCVVLELLRFVISLLPLCQRDAPCELPTRLCLPRGTCLLLVSSCPLLMAPHVSCLNMDVCLLVCCAFLTPFIEIGMELKH